MDGLFEVHARGQGGEVLMMFVVNALLSAGMGTVVGVCGKSIYLAVLDLLRVLAAMDVSHLCRNKMVWLHGIKCCW